MSEKKKFQKGFQNLVQSTIGKQLINHQKDLQSEDDGKIPPLQRFITHSTNQNCSSAMSPQTKNNQTIPSNNNQFGKRKYEVIYLGDEDNHDSDESVSDEHQELVTTAPLKKVKSEESEQKQEHSAPLNLSLTIIVVVRGEITERIYQTWFLQLPKKLSVYDVHFAKQYQGEQNCIIVASPNCSYQSFSTWLGSQTLDESVVIVSSEWVIQAIKHSTVPPFDPFRINPLIGDSKPSSKPILTGADGEEHEEDGTAIKKKRSFIPAYACITSGEFKTLNPNKYITDILEQLLQIYELCGDEWRALGYKKCIGTLKQLPRITHVDQLKGIRGIGDSIREKIQEILVSGKLKKLKYFQDDPKIQSMIELSKIWGVGEKTALKLMKQGYKSVKELRERGQQMLTYQQKIGLKYYEDFQKKIPRAEIEEILEIVKEHCSRIFSQFECQVCGSYRRGKPQSGDIDVLVTPSPSEGGDESFRADSIVRLIQSLSEVGLLTDHLTLPEQFLSSILIKELKKQATDSNNVSSSYSDIVALDGSMNIACRASYMGVCKLAQEGSLFRRIDIKNFAWLDRSMRYYAKRRGYSLSDKELVYEQRIRRFPSKHQIGETIPCSTEEEIFQALGLPYKAPNDRNVFDVDHLFVDQEEEDEFQLLLKDIEKDEYHTSDSDH